MIIDYTTLRNLKKVLTFDFKVRIFFFNFSLNFCCDGRNVSFSINSILCSLIN